MSLKQGSGAKKPVAALQKVVPKNPKYENVKSQINTGQNAAKFFEKNASANLYNAREVGKGFKRIRMATLAKWIETAMLVLYQPDYFDSKESIYDFADGASHAAPPSASNMSLSIAESEASVCGEEKGVPPMFIFGPDLAFKPQDMEKQVEEATTESNRQRNQSSDAFRATQQLPGEFDYAPTSLTQVQYLTTRYRHEKVISRIHLIPDLKLEIFKAPKEDAKAPKRISYLAIPTTTKQFAVIDMRDEEVDFQRQHVFGSVWLPMSQLRRATHRMPAELHYFVKFDESILVLVGPTGAALENAANALVEYGVAQRNVVLLLQGLEDLEKEFPNIIVHTQI